MSWRLWWLEAKVVWFELELKDVESSKRLEDEGGGAGQPTANSLLSEAGFLIRVDGLRE